MKKPLWKFMGCLAGALLATSVAMGQTNRGDTTANIPFAFTVANRTLPPGRYTIIRMGETTLRIFSPENQGTVVQSFKIEGNAPESGGKMVFHRYGDTYFLSEVWVAANGIGRRVFQSRAERELDGKGVGREIAVLRIAR